MRRPLGTHFARVTCRSCNTHAWAGQTQAIAPTGNGLVLSLQESKQQTIEKITTLWYLAGSGYCVKTPRCISGVFYAT